MTRTVEKASSPSGPSGYGKHVGSKVSIVTSSKIRYDGKMTAVDSKASTITLNDVKIIGTEHRNAKRLVLPSRDSYEFIVFKTVDIQELSKLRAGSRKSSSESDSAHEISDSAIVQKRSSQKPKPRRKSQQRKKSLPKIKLPAIPAEEFLFIDEKGNASHLVGRAVPLSKNMLSGNAKPQIIYASEAPSNNRRQSFERRWDPRYQPQRYQNRSKRYQRPVDPVKEFQREMKQKEYAEKEFEKSQDLTKILHNMVHNTGDDCADDEKTKSMREKIVEQWGTEKVAEEEASRHQYNPTESFFDDISRQEKPEDEKDTSNVQNRRPSFRAPYRPQLKIGPSSYRNSRFAPRYNQAAQPVIVYRQNQAPRQFMRNEPLYIAPKQQFYGPGRSRQPAQFQRRYQSNGSRNRNQGRRASQTGQKKTLDPITSQLASLTQKKAEVVAEDEQEPKVTADASIEGITSAMEEIQVS